MALKEFWILPTTAFKFLMLNLPCRLALEAVKWIILPLPHPPTHSGHGRFLKSQGQWRVCAVCGADARPSGRWSLSCSWGCHPGRRQVSVPGEGPRDRTAGGDQALRADQMLLKGGGAPRKMSWEEEGTIFVGGWTSGFWSDRLGAWSSPSCPHSWEMSRLMAGSLFRSRRGRRTLPPGSQDGAGHRAPTGWK